MGTWALPQTKEQAEELKKLMGKKLSAKTASRKITNLLGDDDLFDRIIYLQERDGDNADARYLIKETLKNFLNRYAQSPKDFTKPFENEALEILKTI